MPDVLLPRLRRAFHSRLALSACVPTVLSYDSTGISTCCPSATSLDLALGPDLPRADQLYPGNLRYSAGRIPTFLSLLTGISTCCPSATSFDLALGPDLPRADQLYPGNLRYSAGRIPTFLSLLIPAFSLLKNPLLQTVQLQLFKNAPLQIRIR